MTLTVTTEDGTFVVPVDPDLADDLDCCELALDPGRVYTPDDGDFDHLVMVLCDAVPGDGEFLSVVAA